MIDFDTQGLNINCLRGCRACSDRRVLFGCGKYGEAIKSGHKKNPSREGLQILKWCHQESNRDTRIFSPLLYIELWHPEFRAANMVSFINCEMMDRRASVVDIGNTRVKAALFDGRAPQAIVEVSSLEDPNFLALFQDASIQRGLYAATGKISEHWRSFIDTLPYVFHSFETGMRLPFENEYRSPETLGVDRLANVAAAQVFFSKTNCLVIDAGSCVTYDLLEEGIRYKGGLIVRD